MMNKTKIEWCDFTWNPVTGCLHGCSYCYAARQTKRFAGDIRLNKASAQLKKDEHGFYTLENPFKNQQGKVVPDPVGFEPILHRYRLVMPMQKKKPARVFVCSMADLFGDWVPDEWIENVFSACEEAPWHTYLFLTKNPKRYIELAEKGVLRNSENFWYGTSVTKPDTEFFWHNRLNTFVSIEPIHAAFNFNDDIANGVSTVKWVIIGAETGNYSGKIVPKHAWIEDIVRVGKKAKIPVFMKNNLTEIWGEALIQDFPVGMQAVKDKPIPHCANCKHHQTEKRSRGDLAHYCKVEKQIIPGKSVRTSPSWCPDRK